MLSRAGFRAFYSRILHMLLSLARRSARRLAPLRLAPQPASLLGLRCVPPVPAPCGAVACLAKHAKGGKGKGKGKGKVAKRPVEGAVLVVPQLASLWLALQARGYATQLGTSR